MKKSYAFLLLGLMFLASCGNKPKGPSADALARDSIANQYDQLNQFVDVLSSSMDSISVKQGYLFKESADGRPLTSKEKIKQSLTVFKDMLDRQRARIAELEKSLEDNKNANTQKLRTIINAYKMQLDEKDKMIAQLRTELDSKNVDITNLQAHVAEQDQNISGLNQNISTLNQKTKEQEEAMTAQTNQMNEAFVKVGTKRDLKDAGLLTGGGLFSKKKLDVTNFDKSKFSKVDMRNFQKISISGSSVKVLSPMPANSYTLEQTSKNSFTLTVTNPSKFWSVSTYLVIQHN
jgi:hypothetical protein